MCWRVDDLDAVGEPDALDELGQLVLAFQPAPGLRGCRDQRRCCTNLRKSEADPIDASCQARRTEAGLAILIMRLSTATAMAASPC